MTRKQFSVIGFERIYNMFNNIWQFVMDIVIWLLKQKSIYDFTTLYIN